MARLGFIYRYIIHPNSEKITKSSFSISYSNVYQIIGNVENRSLVFIHLGSLLNLAGLGALSKKETCLENLAICHAKARSFYKIILFL